MTITTIPFILTAVITGITSKMRFDKTLTAIALAGLTTIATGYAQPQCGKLQHKQPQYEFDGYINEERVWYRDEGSSNNIHVLNVLSHNKTINDIVRITYKCDTPNGTNRVTSVEVEVNGHVKKYNSKEILEEAQKRYEGYLLKIKEANKWDGTKFIRKPSEKSR